VRGLWLIGALALLAPLEAALPPAAEELRPAMEAAERRLQDASLQLEVAKHAAQPVQNQVAQARQNADTWWGSWLYKHRLGQLKDRLDRVESARAAQASARQELCLLLTGADEEMSTALETSLGAAAGKRDAGELAQWRAWWQQKRAWQQRLAALEPGAGQGTVSADIQRELKRAQEERERGLLGALYRRGALSKGEWDRERARLEGQAGPSAGLKE
jgi:hypothetical protein